MIDLKVVVGMVGCLAVAGCSKHVSPPVAKPPKHRSPPVRRQRPWPAPQAYKGKPLGGVPWLALTATPDRRGLLIATPAAVERLDGPARAERWKVPLAEGVPRFIAVSGDGSRVAVLAAGGLHGAHYTLVTLDTATGKHRVSRGLHMPAPPSTRGMYQPSWPTGMTGDPKRPGFVVTNAYGAWRVPGGRGEIELKDSTGWSADGVTAQDGSAFWAPSTHGARSTTGASVKLDCPPQRLVVDPRIDRIATVCASGHNSSLRLYALGTGKRLGAWPLAGSVQAMALVAADELEIITGEPSRRARVDESGIHWQPQGGIGGGFEVSPSGRTVLRLVDGSVEVADVASGRTRCIRADLAPWSAGLADDNTAWILGFSTTSFNKLELQRLDVGACKASPPKVLAVGKTTNLRGVWLAPSRAFVFNALVGDDYGPAYVGVDGKVELVAHKTTPEIFAGDDGRRFALNDFGKVDIFQAGTPPKHLGHIDRAPRVVLCGGKTYAYDWNKGWRTLAADGRPVAGSRPPFGAEPQPDLALCRDDRLLVGRIDSWLLTNTATGKVLEVLRSPRGVRSAALLPGAHRVVLAGGPTGWQVVTL